MLESILAFGLLAVLVVLGSLSFVPWESLLEYGQLTIAAGMLFGVPPAIVYHLILFRQLRAHRIDTRGFIWNPIRFHHLLVPAARRGFMPFFYAGGLGFVVVVLGLVLMFAAMFSVFMRGI
jgi:hypothetical protein